MSTGKKAVKGKLTDQEFDYSKNYKFELTKKHSGNFIIPSEARIWDVYTNKQRKIRYSDVEDSPFYDEQDPDSTTSGETIKFIKGELYVSGAQRNKLLYLLAYDGNADKERITPNKHPLFRYKLVDEEQEFKDKTSLRKLKIKVQNALLEASKEELLDFLTSEYNYNPKTGSHDELLEVAMKKADQNPSLVSKLFNTEESRMKAKFVRAFKDQIIKDTKGVITWVDSGIEINTFKLKEGEKITQLMWDWVSKNSKESNDFVKKLATKL